MLAKYSATFCKAFCLFERKPEAVLVLGAFYLFLERATIFRSTNGYNLIIKSHGRARLIITVIFKYKVNKLCKKKLLMVPALRIWGSKFPGN